MEKNSQSSSLVILFDDERSFVPGFRDGAIVLRSVREAVSYFEELRESGQRVSELWLDFVLKGTESTDEALSSFPGELLDRAIFHSSAWEAHGIIAGKLRHSGFSGALEQLWDAYPTTPRDDLFS